MMHLIGAEARDGKLSLRLSDGRKATVDVR